MRPFGFEPDRVTIRESEAELIREAAQRAADGESFVSIARSWDERFVPTVSGATWSARVVQRMVMSQRNRGVHLRSDGQKTPAAWDPIIAPDLAEKVDKVLELHQATRTSYDRRSYLLTGGLVTCGLCGTALLSKPIKTRAYACQAINGGCGKIRIQADLLEDEVGNRVIARLLQDNAREQIQQDLVALRSAVPKAESDSDYLRLRLNAIGRELAQGRISSEIHRQTSQQIKAEMKENRRLITDAEAMSNLAVADAEDLVAWWENASMEDQRTLVSFLVREIAIMPAPVRGSKIFAPERVRIRWK